MGKPLQFAEGIVLLPQAHVVVIAIVAGVPARVIKYRFETETINSLLNTKWWDCEDKSLLSVEKHFFDIEAFLHE